MSANNTKHQNNMKNWIINTIKQRVSVQQALIATEFIAVVICVLVINYDFSWSDGVVFFSIESPKSETLKLVGRVAVIAGLSALLVRRFRFSAKLISANK